MNFNLLKTGLFLGLISGLFLAIGYLFGGQAGLVTAFGLSLVMNIGSYWFSDKLVLSMHRAKPIKKSQYPELVELVKQLSRRAQLPVPQLYLYDSPQPNAFATGRNPQNGVVAVSSGLLTHLDNVEVQGVIAHELAHIKNRDMLIATVAATFASAISYLGNFLFFLPIGSDEEGGNPAYALFAMIAAPLIAVLIQMTISRTREYSADETGARIAGSPHGLASALLKLDQLSKRNPRQSSQLNQAATAHLYISNPLSGVGLGNLFSTHPPTAKRVARLRSISY